MAGGTVYELCACTRRGGGDQILSAKVEAYRHGTELAASTAAAAAEYVRWG